MRRWTRNGKTRFARRSCAQRRSLHVAARCPRPALSGSTGTAMNGTAATRPATSTESKATKTTINEESPMINHIVNPAAKDHQGFLDEVYLRVLSHDSKTRCSHRSPTTGSTTNSKHDAKSFRAEEKRSLPRTPKQSDRRTPISDAETKGRAVSWREIPALLRSTAQFFPR